MSVTSRVGAALLLAAFAVAADAKDDKPPEADAPAKVKPGATALLKAAGKGMRYFLRVPKKYDPKAGARLVVFLHGSNMNGLDYLRSFEAKNWCEDDILCCPNGETDGTGKPSTDPFGQNNFTFGSGPLVADVTTEVQKAFKTTITYVGGHSQGGFLTYSVILNFPDLYRGAIPMAGDCWMQNEPNLWEDKPDVAKKQRLFAPEDLQHQFMLAPVDEAIDWLDAMNGRNEKKSLELAAKWGKDGEWGWVWNAAKGSRSGAPALVKSAEDAATKAIPAITEAMKGKPADWVPKWTEFRRIYGATAAAKPLVDRYLDKRDKQRSDAERLFNESQGLFRTDKRDDAYKTLEKLLADEPCTYQGYFAWKWLSERK